MRKSLLCMLLCCAMLLAMVSTGLAYDGTAPISDEPVTISVLSTNSASLHYDFDGMVWWQEVLNRANVALDFELIDSSSYTDVIKPRLAAAVDLPDLVLTRGDVSDLVAYIDAGIFIDLTGYYDTLGFNLAKQFERHPNLKAELTNLDGSIYYLPYVFTTDSNMRCLMINSVWAKNLGMNVADIQTVDDYYDFLAAVKAGDPNGNGDPTDEIPLFMRSGMIQLWSMYWGLQLADSGGYQVEDDGTVICGYADARYLDFLTWAKKLYDEGLLYNEFATANLDTQSSLFSGDRIGSMIHFISNCTGYSQAINPAWNFDSDAPIMEPTVLTGPYGDQYVYGRDSYGSAFGITSYCKNPEAVFAFCDYLMSEEVGVLTWYGLEGVDYDLVDGRYVFTDAYLGNKDNYLTNMGYNFSGLPSYQLDYMTKQCNAVRQKAVELSEYVLNPSVTFSYKTAEETEVLGIYAADLSTYFAENLTAFIMGTRPLEDWDRYLQDLNAMGLAEVVAVYQAAADRAAAAK
ncbi:MAG TPA: extracellular solute-binding protein [Clostridia bacterium]|nr:extracellular solute-binding protein [Clostridia bacterium]